MEEPADNKQKEVTFVLAYPVFFTRFRLGEFVQFFEKKNYKLKGMRLMNVTEKFLEKHFNNVGRVPQGEHPLSPHNSWVDYLTGCPVFAMILEGYEVVSRIHEMSKQKESPFWTDGGPTAYSSDTIDRAKEDIKMWFQQDEYCLEKAIKSTHLVHVHPDGKSYGPWEAAYNILENEMCDHKPNLHGHLTLDSLSVVVITPKAFHKRCVGDILDAVELKSFAIRGLKLVRKADCPESPVWSDSCTSSETGGDEYAVAMVVDFLHPENQLLIGETDTNNPIEISSSGVYRFSSDYISVSKVGETSWCDIAGYFPYGLTLWVDPSGEFLAGMMFEASLAGLIWED